MRRMVAIVPILAAILIVAHLVALRPGPTREPDTEMVRVLRTISALSVNLVPRAEGFGVARPGSVWEAVAEVQGSVTSVYPRLKSGELIPARSVLLQIDATEYELRVARLEATVQETQAKLEEMTAEELNTKRLLEIEQRSQELARKSFERLQSLAQRKSAARDRADREERLYLQQKKQVQQLQNVLSLIPARRDALLAVLKVQRADLRQAKLDLSKTTIAAPFDCRLVGVDIQSGQFVRTGQSLFKAHGIAVTEVEARFRIQELRHLLSTDARTQFRSGLSSEVFQSLFGEMQALVILQSSGGLARWKAHIDRFRETVDERTREITLVAVVEGPYQDRVPGGRPPLMPGMFCRVEIEAPERPDSVIIPRSAVDDGKVYLVDADERLRTKQVEVLFYQSDFAVIRSGLKPGEQIVVSDPAPAILGMKITPKTDEELRRRLLSESQGRAMRL